MTVQASQMRLTSPATRANIPFINQSQMQNIGSSGVVTVRPGNLAFTVARPGAIQTIQGAVQQKQTTTAGQVQFHVSPQTNTTQTQGLTTGQVQFHVSPQTQTQGPTTQKVVGTRIH